jgi:hypothetical protein
MDTKVVWIEKEGSETVGKWLPQDAQRQRFCSTRCVKRMTQLRSYLCRYRAFSGSAPKTGNSSTQIPRRVQ